MKFTTQSQLWKWQGDGAWYFLTLPKDISSDIKEAYSGPKRGFGSVRVEVHLGGSIWRTSIFPDSSSGSYLLPIKKSIRQAENIDDGSVVEYEVTIL